MLVMSSTLKWKRIKVSSSNSSQRACYWSSYLYLALWETLWAFMFFWGQQSKGFLVTSSWDWPRSTPCFWFVPLWLLVCLQVSWVVEYTSGNFKKLTELWQISGVLLWCQILKRQLSRQMFVRKLLFLAYCFCSLIWIKCFEDKMWIKLPKWIFWETIFEIWKHQCLSFMFSLLRFIWRTFDVIIDDPYLTL